MHDLVRIPTIALLAGLGVALLSSCGLPGALGRSYNRMMDRSIAADESGKAREAMFESLRDIQRELESGDITAAEADSTR